MEEINYVYREILTKLIKSGRVFATNYVLRVKNSRLFLHRGVRLLFGIAQFCPAALLKRLTLVAASAIASCVSELLHVTSKSSDEEKENFLAQVEWLPVTSRTHVTHSLTHSLTHGQM